MSETNEQAVPSGETPTTNTSPPTQRGSVSGVLGDAEQAKEFVCTEGQDCLKCRSEECVHCGYEPHCPHTWTQRHGY